MNGHSRFHLGKNDSRGSLFKLESMRTVNVRTQTLDSLIEDEGIGQVDAVKVDVEGAELQVLRGMRKVVSQPTGLF